MKTREEILQERKIWYSKTFIQFELCKSLLHRELSFLTFKGENKKTTVRYLIAFNIDYLKKHFLAYGFNEKLLNMYQSVALLKNIPIFSYSRNRTKDKKYIEFNENYENFVIGFYLFLDFDGKENFDKCLQEVKEMKKIFDKNKIPYYILNSSFTGFHFHIPYEYMPNFDKNTIPILNEIISNIKGIYEFETLDDSVCDLKRLCKVSYAYSCDGSICLPLNDFQIENFNKENVEMKNVFNQIIIKNRSNLLRKYNLQNDELKKNVIKFLNEYTKENLK